MSGRSFVLWSRALVFVLAGCGSESGGSANDPRDAGREWDRDVTGLDLGLRDSGSDASPDTRAPDADIGDADAAVTGFFVTMSDPPEDATVSAASFSQATFRFSEAVDPASTSFVVFTLRQGGGVSSGSVPFALSEQGRKGTADLSGQVTGPGEASIDLTLLRSDSGNMLEPEPTLEDGRLDLTVTP